jgi:hypothetical protein
MSLLSGVPTPHCLLARSIIDSIGSVSRVYRNRRALVIQWILSLRPEWAFPKIEFYATNEQAPRSSGSPIHFSVAFTAAAVYYATSRLPLQAIEKNLRPLRGNRGGLQIVAQLPNLRQQSLQSL